MVMSTGFYQLFSSQSGINGHYMVISFQPTGCSKKWQQLHLLLQRWVKVSDWVTVDNELLFCTVLIGQSDHVTILAMYWELLCLIAGGFELDF